MAKKSALKKPPLAIPLPADDDEANALLAEYGAAFNVMTRLLTDLNVEVARVKAEHELQAKPWLKKLNDLKETLSAYAAEHRKRLTKDGETKTVRLPAGEVGWRSSPPSVKFTRGVKVEDVIAAIRELRLMKFLRPSVDINKQAMLDDPEKALKVPGVTIVSDVEKFFVAPFGAELAEPLE